MSPTCTMLLIKDTSTVPFTGVLVIIFCADVIVIPNTWVERFALLKVTFQGQGCSQEVRRSMAFLILLPPATDQQCFVVESCA